MYGRRRPTVRGRGFRRGPRTNPKIRIILALGIGLFSLISYLGSKEYNPVTGENQYIGLTPHQEIALGLQAAPDMIQKHGGLYPSEELQALVDRVGRKLVQSSVARDTEWEFDFHLLADQGTINAFALPGGQVFITAALYDRFTTEGQLAGVMGHEIGHVIARHGAQRMAKSKLTQGLTGAVVVASDGQRAAYLAAMVGQMVNMKFGRGDELQSDKIGVDLMSDAGYDPRGMIGVMKVLAEASGGQKRPEFFSTHPNPDNRIAKIEAAIREKFPNGVPSGLVQ